MDNITILITLAGIAAIGILSPGPDFMAVTHASILKARRQGVAVAIGVVFGNVLWAAAALFGVGTLFALFPAFFIGFKVLGGTYLIWMGFKMLKGASKPLTSDTASASGNTLRSIAKGLSTTLANPKAAVYYASALTTVAPENASIVLLFYMLLTVLTVACIWFSCVVFFLSSEKASSLYKRVKTYIETVFGSFIIGFGLKQILER